MKKQNRTTKAVSPTVIENWAKNWYAKQHGRTWEVRAGGVTDALIDYGFDCKEGAERFIARHRSQYSIGDSTQTYWIQDIAPAGNYFDSIGLPGADAEKAKAELAGWRAAFPNKKSRLILRTDVVIK